MHDHRSASQLRLPFGVGIQYGTLSGGVPAQEERPARTVAGDRFKRITGRLGSGDGERSVDQVRRRRTGHPEPCRRMQGQ
ncbi:hypothetical protein, partial [Streptosporangium sandarakinum]